MDFVRRILQYFQELTESQPSEFCSFLHQMEQDGKEYIVTVHAANNGYLVFCVLAKEEWQMIVDISQLTSKNVEDIVKDLASNNEITNIVIDPRDIE